jgi:hypothetical protein
MNKPPTRAARVRALVDADQGSNNKGQSMFDVKNNFTSFLSGDINPFKESISGKTPDHFIKAGVKPELSKEK